MHLFITVIRRKTHKATIVSKALPPYTCSLEDHRDKHGGKKKNRSDFGKVLSDEEKIFLICEDAKKFYSTMILVLWKGCSFQEKDFNIIACGEIEEDARLKKHHHWEISEGKCKKTNIEEQEVISTSSGSEGEPSGTARMTKKEINKIQKNR